MQPQAQPGQHKRADDIKHTDTYQNWNYDVHVLPQLCLFGDVNWTSSYSNARGNSKFTAGTDGNPKEGHNTPTGPKKVMVQPRAAAEDTLLRDPTQLIAKPSSGDSFSKNALKKGIAQRLRPPRTLYRRERFFMKTAATPTIAAADLYDTGNKIFPRRLGRRTQFSNGTRYPPDGVAFVPGAGPGADLDLGFPHEEDLPPDFKSVRPLLAGKTVSRGTPSKDNRLCGAEQDIDQKDSAGNITAASPVQRMLDDQFWPVTPADMPLLRELAYTFLQVKIWEDWSTGKPQSNILGRLERRFPLPERVAERLQELLLPVERGAPREPGLPSGRLGAHRSCSVSADAGAVTASVEAQ